MLSLNPWNRPLHRVRALHPLPWCGHLQPWRMFYRDHMPPLFLPCWFDFRTLGFPFLASVKNCCLCNDTLMRRCRTLLGTELLRELHLLCLVSSRLGATAAEVSLMNPGMNLLDSNFRCMLMVLVKEAMANTVLSSNLTSRCHL